MSLIELSVVGVVMSNQMLEAGNEYGSVENGVP